MAALHLTIAWCKARGLPPPRAATVDHGLRKGSAAEARRVGDWARKLGIQHDILEWAGTKPIGNLQAAARDARYELLGSWARRHGIGSVITGHTIDDQSETLLIRLARGSGLDGLSGMAAKACFPLRGYEDIALLRPLLSFSHARLTQTLRATKQKWIEDPSNDAERFTRVKMRAARKTLEGAGLTPERLAETASHLRRAREAIDFAVDQLLAETVDMNAWGYAILRQRQLGAAPAEIALRALARVTVAVAGEAYPPRFDALEGLYQWLAGAEEPRGRTLGGCRIVRRDDGAILFARESAAIGAVVTLRPDEQKIWDGRFRVAIASSAPSSGVVKALGADGLAVVGRSAILPPVEPHLIAATSPALWTGPRLLAAPLVRYLAPGASPFGFSAIFLGLAKGKGAAKGNSL